MPPKPIWPPPVPVAGAEEGRSTNAMPSAPASFELLLNRTSTSMSKY